MPRSVKLFLWLSAVFALWWLFWSFKFLIMPSAAHIAVFAKLTPAERSATETASIVGELMRAAFFLLPFIFFAVVAGFGRRNWARWGVVFMLVFQELSPLLFVIYAYCAQPQFLTHPFSDWVRIYSLDGAHWAVWTGLAMKLSLVALIYSWDARPWFRKIFTN